MKRSKKGFTIVELVIVIAVIAILAAVLIPTFSSLINKAKESSDTALVKNLNIIMAADEAENGKSETMSEALAAAGKSPCKANAAVARELACWVWEIGCRAEGTLG